MAFLETELLEAKARDLRKLLGIDDQTRPDMMTVIVKLKHAEIIKNYSRGDGSLPIGKEAEYDPDTGILTLREREFVAMNRGRASARFTVAHEAAHAFLKHDKRRFRSSVGLETKRALGPLASDEFQANYVAAAFLVPAHLLPADPHEMTAEQIAAHFGVSKSVAEIRKPVLERLYRRERGINRSLPKTLLDFLDENKGKPRI